MPPSFDTGSTAARRVVCARRTKPRSCSASAKRRARSSSSAATTTRRCAISLSAPASVSARSSPMRRTSAIPVPHLQRRVRCCRGCALVRRRRIFVARRRVFRRLLRILRPAARVSRVVLREMTLYLKGRQAEQFQASWGRSPDTWPRWWRKRDGTCLAAREDAQIVARHCSRPSPPRSGAGSPPRARTKPGLARLRRSRPCRYRACPRVPAHSKRR